MWQQFKRNQRGSIAPLGIALLMTVVLLAVAVLEREWVNYQLQLAEQTADFAAEAAGRMHEAYAAVEVQFYQYWYEPVPTCVGYDALGQCVIQYVDEYRDAYRTETFTARERDLEGGGWRSIAGCGPNAHQPNWSCTSMRERPELRQCRLDATSEQLAMQTFTSNWTNRPAATITGDVSVVLQGGQGCKVIVSAELELRPLFGIIAWTHRTTVRGASVAKPVDLNLAQP